MQMPKITKNMILAAGVILLLVWALSNLATVETAVLIVALIAVYLYGLNWVATRYGVSA
jgi:hypothetical protein